MIFILFFFVGLLKFFSNHNGNLFNNYVIRFNYVIIRVQTIRKICIFYQLTQLKGLFACVFLSRLKKQQACLFVTNSTKVLLAIMYGWIAWQLLLKLNLHRNVPLCAKQIKKSSTKFHSISGKIKSFTI